MIHKLFVIDHNRMSTSLTSSSSKNRLPKYRSFTISVLELSPKDVVVVKKMIWYTETLVIMYSFVKDLTFHEVSSKQIYDKEEEPCRLCQNKRVLEVGPET